jgi:hypothetical protein
MEGSSIDSGIYLLSVFSSWMDILEALESSTTRFRGGGVLGQGPFQLSEFCECCQSVGHLVALPVTIIGSLDVSPNGDDSTRSWHL